MAQPCHITLKMISIILCLCLLSIPVYAGTNGADVSLGNSQAAALFGAETVLVLTDNSTINLDYRYGDVRITGSAIRTSGIMLNITKTYNGTITLDNATFSMENASYSPIWIAAGGNHTLRLEGQNTIQGTNRGLAGGDSAVVIEGPGTLTAADAPINIGGALTLNAAVNVRGIEAGSLTIQADIASHGADAGAVTFSTPGILSGGDIIIGSDVNVRATGGNGASLRQASNGIQAGGSLSVGAGSTLTAQGGNAATGASYFGSHGIVWGKDGDASQDETATVTSHGGEPNGYPFAVYDGSSYTPMGGLGSNSAYHYIYVKAGTGGRIVSGTTGSYKEGDVIQLSASVANGHTFLGWISSNGGAFQNPTGLNTAFTVPADSTTVMACFLSDSIHSNEWEVLRLSNKEAMAAGRLPMATTASLQQAVRIRAQELISLYEHTRPDGSSYSTVFNEVGVPLSVAGENIYQSPTTAAKAVQGWMNSPGHKANILRGNSHMGTGYHYSSSARWNHYWVQLFANAGEVDFITVPPVPTYKTGTNIESMQAYLILTHTDSKFETSYIPLISEMVSGYNSAKEGTQIVTVTYQGMQTQVPITLSKSASSGGSGSGGSGSGGSGSGGSSGGSRGGGSGGGAGARTDSAASTGMATTAVATRSSNVNTDGSVSASAIQNEMTKALASATGNIAIVKTRNATNISAATLKQLAAAAEKKQKTAILHADTLTSDSKSIQGRLYVEPAKLAGITSDLKLGVYTDAAQTTSVRNLFVKHYRNSIAVIKLDHQGPMGTRLQVAAKVDLSGMSTENLVFYSYNRSTGKYTRIESPSYTIDETGYLHFYTSMGGDVVVSSGTLINK